MTKRAAIMEQILSDLRGIRAGQSPRDILPPDNDAYKYTVTVKTVQRLLTDPGPNGYPLLVVAGPRCSYRPLLRDCRAATMRLTVSGALLQPEGTKDALAALDGFMQDAHVCLQADPTWGGTSLRTRVLEDDSTPEGVDGAFSISVEIDYMEYLNQGRSAPALAPRPVNGAAGSVHESVLNKLHNHLLTYPDLVYIERAKEWPVPTEQISIRQLPGIWMFSPEVTMQYVGSMQAIATTSVSILVLEFDDDAATFARTVDAASTKLREAIGSLSDPQGQILAEDIRSIRTGRSEFPVAAIEADITLRTVGSILSA